MSDNSEKLFGDDFNPNDRSQILPRGESAFVTKTPEEAIIKLVKFSKDKTYILMNYIKHKVGQSEKDTRDHVCLQSLGEEVSPERDRFFEARKVLKELKANGGSKTDIARWESVSTKFRPSTRGWLCVVTPNNPKLQAYRYPQSVIDDIFGVDEKYATDYRPARKGILNQMLEEGRSPFDCRSELGWIKITKTGTGIATRYQVAEYESTVTEVQGNKKVTYSEPGKATVNPKILELTLADVPNVYNFERKFAFTLDEARAFVESNGTNVPARLLKKANGGAVQAGVAAAAPSEDEAPAGGGSLAGDAAFTDSDSEDATDALPF